MGGGQRIVEDAVTFLRPPFVTETQAAATQILRRFDNRDRLRARVLKKIAALKTKGGAR